MNIKLYIPTANYSELTEEKLKEHGEIALFTKKGNSWELKDEYTNINKFINFYEIEMWKSAANLSTHIIKKYSPEEVKESLHFLYHTLSFIEGKELLKPVEITDGFSEAKADAQREKILDKFKKAGNLLWKIEKNLELPKNVQKKTIIDSMEIATTKMQKLLENYMSLTDRVALDKYLKKAFKIIKDYEKQLE